MSQSPGSTPRFPIIRRLWKPALATGIGGGATAIWLDEIIAFSAEILGLIMLPFLAGVIYLFDILLFKSHMPRREDIQSTPKKGTRK